MKVYESDWGKVGKLQIYCHNVEKRITFKNARLFIIKMRSKCRFSALIIEVLQQYSIYHSRMATILRKVTRIKQTKGLELISSLVFESAGDQITRKTTEDSWSQNAKKHFIFLLRAWKSWWIIIIVNFVPENSLYYFHCSHLQFCHTLLGWWLVTDLARQIWISYFSCCY